MLLLCMCVLVYHGSAAMHIEHVAVDTSKVVQEISDMFIGVTVDSSKIHSNNTLQYLRSGALMKYSKALLPSYVRFGGTEGDQMTYDLNAKYSYVTQDEHGFRHYHLPAIYWDDVNEFVHKTGFKFIFGLNEFDQKNRKWDLTYAKALIDYSHRKGYPIAGFELGNEPNLFERRNITISEAQLGSDFKELKALLQSGPYKHSLLLGPDTAGYKDSYMRSFLSHGGSVVDIITFHGYYMNGHTAKISDFSDAKLLDKIRGTIQEAVQTAGSLHPPKTAWYGETSSAYGGGMVGVSDRYVAGFMWLDKLGLSARYGLKGVMRQALFGGHYGLLTYSMEPNPDYWLTLLYKRLVGNKVFDVKTSSRNIRIYAHCTKHNNEYNFKPGSLTVYAMNLNSESIMLQFSHLHGHNNMQAFWLSPDANNLTSQKVQLNGKTITSTAGSIPPLSPKHIDSGTVTAPGKTFGFVVIPEADIAECKTGTHGHIIG